MISKISQECKDLIVHFEGNKAIPYLDQGKRWTVGIGHLMSPAEIKKYKDTIVSKEQIDTWFKKDIEKAEKFVSQNFHNLNQNQFDALCSLIFNIGTEKFPHSNTFSLLKQGKFTEASNRFVLYNKVDGKQSSGLLRRRKCEKMMFNGATTQDLKKLNWLMI